MIILRQQKEFSSRSTQIAYQKEKIKNKLSTLPARLQRGFHESRGELGKRAIADLRVKENTKSKRQLMRDAILAEKKKKANRLEMINASATKGGTVRYIGKKAGEFVQTAAENPITATGIAFGYGTTPAQIAAGQYWGPIGEIATGAEQAAKKAFPKYKKLTETTGNFAKKHKAKERTSRAVQSILASVV